MITEFWRRGIWKYSAPNSYLMVGWPWHLRFVLYKDYACLQFWPYLVFQKWITIDTIHYNSLFTTIYFFNYKNWYTVLWYITFDLNTGAKTRLWYICPTLDYRGCLFIHSCYWLKRTFFDDFHITRNATNVSISW